MILFSMMRDYVVNILDVRQLAHQDRLHGWVDTVQQGRFLRPSDEVGVVAGSIREGNQRIEQTAIPVNRTHPLDSLSHLSWLHRESSFFGSERGLRLVSGPNGRLLRSRYAISSRCIP